jgi:hypothetical protein
VGIGTCIVVIAIGAILDFAVKINNSHVNINTIGLIIVGAVGLVSRFSTGTPGADSVAATSAGVSIATVPATPL